MPEPDAREQREQHEKQLHEFQSGARNNDVMNWMATALSASLAAFDHAFFCFSLLRSPIHVHASERSA